MTEQAGGPATAEEHIAEARRFAAAAENCRSDLGRSVDLQAAQVHATIAQTLTAEKVLPMMARLAAYLEEPAPSGSSDEKESAA